MRARGTLCVQGSWRREGLWNWISEHAKMPPALLSRPLWRGPERPLLSNVNKTTPGRGEEGLWYFFLTIWNVKEWLWVYHLQNLSSEGAWGERRRSLSSEHVGVKYLQLWKVWTVQPHRNPGRAALRHLQPTKDSHAEHLTNSYK